MSTGSIYMNYASAVAKAERLEELAGQLYNAAKKNESEITGYIDSSWEGQAGDVFNMKNRRCADKIRLHARQLDRCAGMLRQAALDYYRTEMLIHTLKRR